jgi:death-on-curing family protein
MARRGVSTLAELALEAEMDLDEALVTLWDAGLTELNGPRDPIPASKRKVAERALGLASRGQLTDPAYWRPIVEQAGQSFDEVLVSLDIRLSPSARRLPKGAVRRLRRFVTARALPVPIDDEVEPPPAGVRLEWRTVGREVDVRHLSAREIAGIHTCLEEDFADSDDPIAPPGIRDQNLLDSAANRPMTSLGNVSKYPSAEMAAAALLHSVALNHAFFNGNKRTALVALLVSLDENGLQLTCGEDELFRLVLHVTQHRIVDRRLNDLPDREVLATADWIKERSRRVEHGERVMKWIRFRRILSAYGCWTEFRGGVGNRINIYRDVVEPRRFGRSRTRHLSTQVRYNSEGSEVGRDAMRKIRADLELDDEHGIDSQSFYSMEVRPAMDFIVSYRKTLRRLAKL